jgi:hypothetical protein
MSGPVINMNIHHLADPPAASLVKSQPPFVALELSTSPAQVNLFLHTRADCDALIAAAQHARDLLPEPPEPPRWDEQGFPLNDAAADLTVIKAVPAQDGDTP